MRCQLDHLVIVIHDLEESSAWLTARTGSGLVPGGRHAAMATHNRLLRLGAGEYLELLAVDRDAGTPDRPRWFELDLIDAQAHVDPAPSHLGWVARCNDLDTACRLPAFAACRVLSLSRGDFSWRITVPDDGTLLAGGAIPYLIAWQTAHHPAPTLPDAGCELVELLISHPDHHTVAATLGALGLADPRIRIGSAPAPRIAAALRTPRGLIWLAAAMKPPTE